MSFKVLFALFTALTLLVSGCASSAMKQRKEQRDKVATNSHLYCEFINGEVYTDVDVALNIEMAKRCDSEKPYTITQYKTPSENQGVIYCCTIAPNKSVNPVPERKDKKAADKKTEKAGDSKELDE